MPKEIGVLGREPCSLKHIAIHVFVLKRPNLVRLIAPLSVLGHVTDCVLDLVQHIVGTSMPNLTVLIRLYNVFKPCCTNYPQGVFGSVEET